VERHARTLTGRDVCFMLLVAPLDLLLYRTILFRAQFKGMIRFQRGEREWNTFARNARVARATPLPSRQ